MPLILRPAQPNALSDPLYTGGGAPISAGTPRIPAWLKVIVSLTVVAFLSAYLPGSIGRTAATLRWLMLLVAIAATVPFLYRITRHSMLWRLRNKLILTYLLIGLTPVVLFFTLVFLAAYAAAGQFAIHLASSHLQLQLDNMGTSDAGLAFAVARQVDAGATLQTLRQRDEGPGRPAGARAGDRQRAVYLDDEPIDLPGVAGNARSPLRLVPWIKERRAGQSKVFVSDGGVLYMAVVDRVAAGNGHVVTVIGSAPLNEVLVNRVADGLGQVALEQRPLSAERDKSTSLRGALRRQRIFAGHQPLASNLLDGPVAFASTLSVVDWESGAAQPIDLRVSSRPSVLFEQLFGTGLTARISDTVRFFFIAVCLFFGLLEIFALYIAVRITRTMTGSVEDLYAATLFIDSGNLAHRIQVQRDDQLADLCRSFNRMSWSLSRLIDEQKEKERMQSELSIAQEVQANLFPRASLRVPSLELHGVCRPARTVSGDYYDFLVFHDDPGKPDEITGMGLALGDISGKGISAALLMATLHAAVRAYRFASEELFTGSARSLTHQESLECGELFESPARILSLLNRHLYRSTQPEKYATLFLAHYDDRSGRLTYSNGGQLPPFIMRRDGSVRLLERGGTVVGLMDGMQYEQETVPLEPGDLVIAYSDGVTEPENDFGEFGEDRMLEVIRRYRHEPLATISAEVMAALDAWIGDGEQPDDITLVLARKT